MREVNKGDHVSCCANQDSCPLQAHLFNTQAPVHTYRDIFESATFSLRIHKFPGPHVAIPIEFACPHASHGIRIHYRPKRCTAILETGHDFATSSDPNISADFLRGNYQPIVFRHNSIPKNLRKRNSPLCEYKPQNYPMK